jgi:hypothetical protein
LAEAALAQFLVVMATDQMGQTGLIPYFPPLLQRVAVAVRLTEA